MRYESFVGLSAAKAGYAAVAGDCVEVLRSLPKGSVDLVLGSPPYEDARLYGELGYEVRGEEWVEWMVTFFRAAVRVTRGLVVMVVGHGKTKDYRWSATPALLMADLHRKGFALRCPVIYSRVGIAGSGGPDYLRYDYEFCVVVQNKEFAKSTGELPWSNNLAGGKPPKWAPGGEMSHRLTSGKRVNAFGGGTGQGGERRKGGERQPKGRPGDELLTRSEAEAAGYAAPRIANPGIVLEESYGARQVAGFLGGGNLVHGNVGGGCMGHDLAHENEAPYPLWIAERHVLAFCPPGGVVIDPFVGSGTTMQAAVENGRRGFGIDLRPGQVELTHARMKTVQPRLVIPDDRAYEERRKAKAAGKKAKRTAAVDHPPAGEVGGLFDGR